MNFKPNIAYFKFYIISILLAMLSIFSNCFNKGDKLQKQFSTREYTIIVAPGIETSDSVLIDLNEHKYLIDALDSVHSTLFNHSSDISSHSFGPLFKLPPQNGFSVFLIKHKSPGTILENYILLVSISKKNKVIDCKIVSRIVGTEASGEFVYSRFESLDKVKIITELRNNNQIISTTEEFQFEATGKLKKISESKMEYSLNSTIPLDSIFIFSDAVGEIKLGMNLIDINNLHKFSIIPSENPHGWEIYAIVKEEKEICTVSLKNGVVISISPGENLKTGKGISENSTLDELKKQYNDLEPKFIYDGSTKIGLSVKSKELPFVHFYFFQITRDLFQFPENEVFEKLSGSIRINNIEIINN